MEWILGAVALCLLVIWADRRPDWRNEDLSRLSRKRLEDELMWCDTFAEAEPLIDELHRRHAAGVTK